MINKFKIYDKELGEIYNFEDMHYITFNGGGKTAGCNFIKNESLHSFMREEDGEIFYQKYDRFVVLNYTGFKDYKGVEIYEGDLLKNNEDLSIYYKVSYFEELGSWMATDYEYDSGFSANDHYLLSELLNDYPNVEVFGNDLILLPGPAEEGKDE
jgi:hypothetical protein